MDVRRDNPDNTPRRPVVSTDEVRQGTTGHNVRYVLAVGTVSVIVLFALIWTFYFAR